MRELEASVLTFNLDRVKEELARLGLGSITVSEAAVSPADFLPRIQMRVVVPDHLADRAAEVLRREA